jgi:hypothetical protein
MLNNWVPMNSSLQSNLGDLFDMSLSLSLLNQMTTARACHEAWRDLPFGSLDDIIGTGTCVILACRIPTIPAWAVAA